jgi:putative membrane-bound dehydrogenase-like protein
VTDGINSRELSNGPMKLLLACFAPALGFIVTLNSQAAQFKLSNQTFTVPDGFEVEVAAIADLAPRPISGSFDELGRLYVTDSSGSNEKPDFQLTHPSHRVLCLEDTNGDGKFDRITVFADKVMFPEGCLWYDGSVYVCAPPSIWKFTDTNGDGVADKREEWYQGKTLTGCANDLHGPYLGPEGYIYWTKGAFAEQTHVLGNGRIIKDKAAHLFRARPDGSDLDVIMSGGMDNPVEVAFTPAGEALFTSTFIDFSQPGYRDGIAYAVYGGVFGKIQDVIEDGRVKRTSPEVMHPFYEAGPAAECALCRYEGNVFGDEYRDNLFATSFNLRKVTRHILKPKGAAITSTDSDFLVSDSTDFHPTDVLEDPDGSLLVIDTGGWYKLCCPSSQLAKPDVLGTIYRVRRKSAPKVEDPSGLKIRWAKMSPGDLVKLLGDKRFAVRNRALGELGKEGDAAVTALTDFLAKTEDLTAAQGAAFVLGRIATSKAVASLWASLHEDAVSGVSGQALLNALRQTKFKVLSMLRATPANDADRHALASALSCEQPQLRRVAAELAGRIGDVKQTGALLRVVAESGGDPILIHSATYALIEINSPKVLRKELARYRKDSSDDSVRAASARAWNAGLIALDQMDAGDLTPEDVTPFLASSDPELRKAAVWVAGHHRDWGGALAGYFRERLTANRLSDADRAGLEKQLTQFAGDGAIQKLMADVLSETATPTLMRQVLLHAMANANLAAPPATWASTVIASLESKDESIVKSAVATARVVARVKPDARDFSPELMTIATDKSRPAELRLDAMAALPGRLNSVDVGLLSFLFANLDPAKPVAMRAAASSVLAQAKLNEAQLLALADTIKTVGPMEVSRLLAAFEQQPSEAVGLKLMAALKESKGFSGVRPDALKSLMTKYPPTVQEKGNELLALLNVDESKQKAHLDELLATLPKGDVRGGQAVFNSAKAACTSCHKMGYVGGNVGPDLTRIGQARTERDLLEAIVYPSASFVRSYEPVLVLTKDDEAYSGVLRKDAADEIVLVTGPNAEVHVARSDITEIRPSKVSVMPAGLDTLLSKQELADLVAFLKNTK